MATKTITLTGAEIAVTGLDGAHAHIRNDGTDVIYAAKTSGITAGADGVLGIPAGQAATVYGISGTVYMLGTGSAQIISNDYSELPFKTSAASGGSGADEVARTAINTHAGNDEIHVTAEEKSNWSGKAELSDIPTTLPANGGNSETVNGKTVEMAIYCNTSSLGVSDTDTADTIWKAMPSYSIFATGVQLLTDPSWNFPAGSGQMTILMIKLSNVRPLGMYLYPKTNGYVYFANVDSNGAYAGNWRRICDGGDAATLGTHPASDFALKSELDALEARVAALEAALEGGTT